MNSPTPILEPSGGDATSALVRSLLIVVMEGTHDLEFLRHIARVLRAAEGAIPDIGRLAERGELLLIPAGGSPLAPWATRLAALGLPQFHLFDRESGPETQIRHDLVCQIKCRPNCFAALTRKRALENYLHPRAIAQAGGPEITVTDDNSVAEMVARRRYCTRPEEPNWFSLSRRSQRRLACRAKRWLHRWVTPRMTAELLAERDPEGEVHGWLRMIAEQLPRQAP